MTKTRNWQLLLIGLTASSLGMIGVVVPWLGVAIATEGITLISANTDELTATEVNAIAAEITVRIEGPKGGSGVIVEKQDHTYYVLTNWHVVNRIGDYEIITADGRRHSVYYSLIQRIPGLDLAIVPFSSSQRYQIATMANPESVNVGDTVHVAGWPRSGSSLGQRLFFSSQGQVTHRQNRQQGYSLVYTNLVRSGMSGGPVLDSRGNLIGINGIVQFGLNPDTIAAAAIEINRFWQWRKTATLPSIPTPPQPVAREDIPTVVSPPTLPVTGGANGAPGAAEGGFAMASRFKQTSGQIMAIATTDSLGISGNSNGTVDIWNLATGGLRQSFSAHNREATRVLVTPNGQQLITAGEDGIIRIWDLAAGLQTGSFSPVQTITGHNSAILAIAISSDGKTLASGGWDGSVKLWDLATGSLQQTLEGHSQLVGAIAISPDGKTLATGSRDRTIRLWNLETGALKRTLEGHELSVLSLAISPNGEILASGSADGTITIWKLDNGQPIRRLSGHRDGVWSVAIASNNQTLVSGSWDKTVKVWNLTSGTMEANLGGHTGYVTAIAISSDQTMILSGDWDGEVKVWKRP